MPQSPASDDAKMRDLTAELEKPETYESGRRVVTINRDLMTISDNLTRLTAEWEALSAKSQEAE